MSEPPASSPETLSLPHSTQLVTSVVSLLAVVLTRPESAVGHVMGALTVMVVVPLLAGWLRLQGRPHTLAGAQRLVLVAPLAMLVACATSTFGSGEPSETEARVSPAGREIEAPRRTSGPEAEGKAAEQAAQLDDHERMDEFGAGMRELRAQQVAFEARLLAATKGLEGPAELDSRAKIDARLELLRQAHGEGVALVARLKEALAKGPDRQELRTGGPERWVTEGRLWLQLRESEVRRLAAYLEMYGLLREHFDLRKRGLDGSEFAEGFPLAAFEAVLGRIGAEIEIEERLDAEIQRARAATASARAP
jgi:hypothetical protein